MMCRYSTKPSSAIKHSTTQSRARVAARITPATLFAILLFLITLFLIAPSPAHAQTFDPDGTSASGWIDMFRTGNITTGEIADPGNSSQFAVALRGALRMYSNALLIVASIILLYHLLIMTGETAHQGVVGGKRTNQVWAPMRLVIAIGLLVPLSSGLNSAQYMTLQVIEWGSNMASRVWYEFIANAGSGAGTNPIPHMPDTGSIGREAAKIGACMHIYNYHIDQIYRKSGKTPPPELKVSMRSFGMTNSFGTAKYENLCGSIIVFDFGMGAATGLIGLLNIVNQMQPYLPYFVAGGAHFGEDPGPAPTLLLPLVLGTLESVSGGWNSAAGSAGSGWVSAGGYFLSLAAGGSNRVSGTDTLPIVIGPKTSMFHNNEQMRTDFFTMAEWIVNKYSSNISGGGANANIMGDTVAGRKFVDLLLLFMDQLGVISGLWSPGSVAFYIDLNNSPLAELVDLGHRMIRTALDCVGAAVDLGVNEPQNAMYSAQLGSKQDLAFGPKSGLFWAAIAIPVLSAFASTLMTMGIMIGIFTPMLPFFKFVLSVLTWLALVAETLVCAPLMALAYLTPYGEGFAGQKVEPSYHLIMHTFLRPVMTIFGLIASILLFNIAAHLVTTFYQAITSNAGAFKGGMAVVAKLAFGNMYVSMLYTCLNMALKVIDTFAKHATRWIGGNSHEENMGDAQQAISMAAQGVGMMGQIGGSLGFHASGAASQLSGHSAPNPHPEDPTRQNPNASAGKAFGANASHATTPNSGAAGAGGASGAGGNGAQGKDAASVEPSSGGSSGKQLSSSGSGGYGSEGSSHSSAQRQEDSAIALEAAQARDSYDAKAGSSAAEKQTAKKQQEEYTDAYSSVQGQIANTKENSEVINAIKSSIATGGDAKAAAQSALDRTRAAASTTTPNDTSRTV